MEDDVFFLPLHILEKSAGFSLDVGGSLAKIAYVPKIPPTNIQVPESMGVVKLTSFPRTDADSVVAFLSDNCRINRPHGDDVMVVEATGIGMNLIRRQLCESLNIRIDNKPEFELSLRTFNVMRQANADSAFYPECADVSRDVNRIKEQVRNAVMIAMSSMNLKEENNSMLSPPPPPHPQQPDNTQSAQTDDATPCTENDDVYPFMMVLIGSGAIMIRINGPDDFQPLDITTRAGRYFHGLCSLLTGCESFTEILALAEKGDNRSVDVFTDDNRPANTDDDQGAYASLPDGLLGVSFGKACGKTTADFRREDICKAMLVSTCLDISQIVYQMARRYGLHKVYMGGMFIHPEIVRSEITKQMKLQEIFPNNEKEIELKFMNYGGYLGAIGGLIPRDLH